MNRIYTIKQLWPAFALSFIGVGAALLEGWLGGELVERLGVGVAPDANLNAPNSLTHPHEEIP